MNDHIDAVLDLAFPDQRRTDVRRLESDSPHDVFAVTTADGHRFVVKCAPEGDDGEGLAREVAVTNYVRRETDVPVVDVVRSDLDPETAPVPYFVARWADGQNLGDACASLPRPAHGGLFRNLGETLGTLHEQTSFEACGDVVATGPASFEVERDGPWPERFAAILADHVEALGGTRFEDLAEDVWEYVTERLRRLDTGESPVLLHGDVGDENVLYDGTTVSRVLDWERASVGHPEYDLCRAEVRFFWSNWGTPDRLQTMLYSGYRSRRDLPDGFDVRRSCYLATFYLQTLASFDQWAPRLADDPDSFADGVAEKIRGVIEE